MLSQSEKICKWKDVNLQVDNPEIMKAYQCLYNNL